MRLQRTKKPNWHKIKPSPKGLIAIIYSREKWGNYKATIMNIIKKTDQKIQELLVIKEKESNILPEFQYSINVALLFELVDKEREKFDKCKKEQKKLLYSCGEEIVREIYTFYYYGGEEVYPSTSFYDMVKRNRQMSMERMVKKILGVAFRPFRDAWESAKEKFDEHEKNVPQEKENLEKRLRAYEKKGNHSHFKFEKRHTTKSTREAFLGVQQSFNLSKTDDIKIAKEIIENIIKETNGGVVVDFLGAGSCDHLDYVECNDEILKIYWKYSSESHFPHNMRIDIALDRLEFIEGLGIVLKGYYRSKKELKEYYFNKEKILNKAYSPAYIEESKNSSFRHYTLIFDKKQRGSVESFDVTFLPWRYYTVLIQGSNHVIDKRLVDGFLIKKNLQDIEARIDETIKSFRSYSPVDEDEITMFGNRFRKNLESLLKFILLGSEIMFKENYEKDMMGSILEQLKSAEKYKYNSSVVPKIIKAVEGSLLTNLNLCSHENVSHKIDGQIIEDIYLDMVNVLELGFEFFNFERDGR